MAIRKTTILLTVLHDEVEDIESWSFDQIAGEMNEGCLVGAAEVVTSEEVAPQSVESELLRLGNDGTFFEQN